MPGRGPQTFKKRQKEQERKERRQEKLAKRLAKKHNRDGEPESGESSNDELLDVDSDAAVPTGVEAEPEA